MKVSQLVLSLALSLSSAAYAQQQNQGNIISQSDMIARGLRFNPRMSAWIKPEAGLAYRIPRDISTIPDVIRNNIGSLDNINKWIPNPADQFRSIDEYFAKNAGSVINLQYTNGAADFYVIGAETKRTTYIEVPSAEGLANQKLVGKLSSVPGMASLLSSDPNVIGVKKVTTVFFVRVSELGIAIDKEATFEAPGHWGAGQTQTKPAGEDAYVNFEILKQGGQKIVAPYIVNTEPVRLYNGNIVNRPAAYVPADELALLVDRNGVGKAEAMPTKFVRSSGLDNLGRERTPTVFGFLPEKVTSETVLSKIGVIHGIADLRAERAAKASKGAGESVRVEDVIKKAEKSK